MTPGVYNIEAKQSDWILGVNWTDNGELPDLAGFTASMIVRYKPDSEVSVLVCTDANDRIALGGEPFNIVISVKKAVMYALKAGMYVYDLELVNAAGDVFPILTGRFTVVGTTVAPAPAP